MSVDFNHQSLAEQLLAAGFDQSKSTVFTLEGVSQYITKEAVTSTIKEIAALSQKTSSTFFISYVDTLLDKDPVACFGKGYPKAAKRAETIKQLSAKVGGTLDIILHGGRNRKPTFSKWFFIKRK